MPQDQRRKSCDEYDVISSDFPPPSLKPVNSPEVEKRKKKKWSIGGLFRRKKKVSDTESSSPLEDEEEKKGFLEKRRARKKRNRGSKDVTGSFEHVIINHRQSQVFESPAELREVSNEKVALSHDSLAKRGTNHIRGSSVSLEGAGRRGGKLQVKARVEATRERFKGESSSDEGGGSSRHSSSSIQRIKGDESSSKDGSLSRRSRAARTERYKKRLSRDDESLREFQVPSRISRSDERLVNKKTDKTATGNRWTAKVVYYESSDYDTKYTAITKSATPSPIQSPKVRPKNALHYTVSAPPGSNYVTYPPSHAKEGVAGSFQELRSKRHPSENIHGLHQRFPDATPHRLPKSNSDMITKAAQFPNSIQRNYPAWGQDALNRKSASYDCNVNSIHHVNNQISQSHPTDENVLVVQFPLGRPNKKMDTKLRMGIHPNQQNGKQQNPPPPPPRDPHRRLMPANGYNHESSPRPMSYAFEDRKQTKSKYHAYTDFGSSTSAFQRVPQSQPVPIDFEPVSSINKHHRSCSDNHIPSHMGVNQSPPMARRQLQKEHLHRNHQGTIDSYASSPPSDHSQSGVPYHYQYYTDQQPRSRKPIHIAYQSQKPQNDPYLSDSQVIVKPPLQQTPRTRPPSVQNAADFWKQKDQENAKKIHISEGSPKLIQRHLLNLPQGNERSRSNSPMKDVNTVSPKLKLPPLIMPVKRTESSGSITSQPSPRESHSPRTPTGKRLVHNEIGIPVFDSVEGNNIHKRPLSMLEEKQEISEQEVSPVREKTNPPTPPKRRDSKVNAVTNFEHFDIFSDNEMKDGRRNSSNLEEALNELEAIYKSLRLGEDNYLEKVAKEQAIYENNRLDPSNWNAWVQSRGFESDSSFNYSRSSLESVDSVDSPLKRSNSRRSGLPDRVTDDMAYRRLNKKDRTPPHEQEVISQAGSFLLVSPTLSPPPFVDPPPVPQVKKEPDVEKDDVVYRNIKHVNNTLKCLDPQPPFGIPLGPVTPAPNTDYLHVTPKETYRPSFKPRKIPDVVTDDLAFRNLRKDNNKEPLFTAEDSALMDSPTLRKKRAVRSLSANLLSIIERESVAMKNNNNKLMYNNNSVQGELEKSQSFTDVIDALNIRGPGSNGQTLFVGQTKLGETNTKKNLSGEDSDVTPRVSRSFSVATSSPLTASSTETLTGSKSSLLIPESKMVSNKSSKSPSPRLSLTPERRHTTDSVNFYSHKSASPAKYVPVKSDSFKNTFSASFPKSDFHRSPTPDSRTLIHHSDRREETPPIYDKNESDLLVILAREAKEASEQLSKELNEMNFENNTKTNLNNQSNLNENENQEVEKIDSTSKSEVYTKQHVHTSKPLSIGKIIPHKPVKLNAFCITEDNLLENKQTIVTNKPVEIEGSKSMTDLLKELTRSLDIDFGCSPKESKNEVLKTEIENDTYKSGNERGGNVETTIINNFANEDENCSTDVRECQENYVLSDEEVSDERFSSPEKFLQAFVAKSSGIQKGQVSKIVTPVSETISKEIADQKNPNAEFSILNSLQNETCLQNEHTIHKANTNIYLEENPQSNEQTLQEVSPVVNISPRCDQNDTPLLNLREKESNEIAEVLNLLNERSPSLGEQMSEASSPLLNKFPVELPHDDVTLDNKPLISDISSHSLSDNQTSESPGLTGAVDDCQPPGCSKDSRLPDDRLRDSLDCARMTDEGTKTVADPGTLLLVCMACAHQLAGLELDFLTILGIVLAIACLFLFLVL